MIKLKLAYVKWTDALGVSHDWEDPKDAASMEPVTCYSVGWIVRDDDKCIVIAGHCLPERTKDADPQLTGAMCIPRHAIQKRKYIKIND